MHRKARIVLISGLLLVALVAACGQAMPTQTAPPTTESPSSAKEHFARGNELSRASKFQEAVDEYRKALAADPKNVDALTNLGVAYYSLEEFDDAIKQYLQAVELAPKDGDIHSNLAAAYVQKYQLNKAQNQLDRALEEYEKALELKPDLAEAHYGLGVVYALLGRNQDAIEAFETFQKLDKGNSPQATENAKQYLLQLRGE